MNARLKQQQQRLGREIKGHLHSAIAAARKINAFGIANHVNEALIALNGLVYALTENSRRTSRRLKRTSRRPKKRTSRRRK